MEGRQVTVSYKTESHCCHTLFPQWSTKHTIQKLAHRCTVDLLAFAKTWKQLRCPSVSEWIHKYSTYRK